MLQKLLIGSAPLLPKFVSGAPQDITNFGNGALKRDDFSSNRHPALSFCLSMIFSENRQPLFRIMLEVGDVLPHSMPVWPKQGCAMESIGPIAATAQLRERNSRGHRRKSCGGVRQRNWSVPTINRINSGVGLRLLS